MKRLFYTFVLCIVSIATIAQIAPVKTTENPREMLCISEVMYLYRTKADNNYVMELYSSNQYEKKIVILNLGKGASQALKSVENLRKATQQIDTYFTVDGYKFYATDGFATIKSGPGMQYTAGVYDIRDCDIDNAVICLLYKMNMTSECELWVAFSCNSKLRLELKIPKYNIKTGSCTLNIEKEKGEIPDNLVTAKGKLSEEQLNSLKEALERKDVGRHSCYDHYRNGRESQYVRLMFNKIMGITD